MDIEKLKQLAFNEIDKHRDDIIQIANSIEMEPEEGFKEFKTAKKIAAIFEKLDYPYEEGLAITGVKATLKGRKDGPCIGILGEEDALFNSEHPKADKNTGIVHACGHFAQVAWLAGIAYGLKHVIEHLDGKVVLFAVPAEELINLGFRQSLRDQGKLSYFGGKQELIKLGAFDDIDMAFLQHAQSTIPGRTAFTTSGSNGFVSKYIRFIGESAHAGVAPWKGVNALNAFHVALSAIHAQRETFKDDDAVRIHMLLVKGGESVNVIPSEIELELFVRASSFSAIKEVSDKIDQALKAGAMGIGCSIEIRNSPGYLPMNYDKKLTEYWEKSASKILGEENIHRLGFFGGSTDFGDVMHLMPAIEVQIGGYTGGVHSKEFRLQDEEMGLITPVKVAAATIIDLLSNDAEVAKDVLKDFKPLLTKEKYLEFLDSFFYTSYDDYGSKEKK
ncbi:MAG: amidohydrolase [Bacteroidales bacterium]|nr:amidohydrolase [Bacteroidales bacterium]